MKKTALFIVAFCAFLFESMSAEKVDETLDSMIPSFLKTSVTKLENDLIQKHGISQKERIKRGIRQVAIFWKKEDG